MFIKKLQEGGAAPVQEAPQNAPQEGQQQDQMMQQLAQMAQEIIQQIGPDAAAALAQMILDILQNAQPVSGEQPQDQQFMRKGGKICKKVVRRVK